jgi:hypothetical protein
MSSSLFSSLGRVKKSLTFVPEGFPVQDPVSVFDQSLVGYGDNRVLYLFGEKKVPGGVRTEDHQFVILLKEGDEVHQPGGMAEAFTVAR